VKTSVLTLVSLAVVLMVTLAYGQQTRPEAKTWPDAFPKKGENGVPESVDKLTIAVDSWGTSELNPWTITGTSFLGDYYNLRLMMQAPNGDLTSAWVLSYKQTNEGLTFKLNPKATFADGTPADAEALKTNLEAFMGKFVGQFGYTAPVYNSATASEFMESVQVKSPTEVFVKTRGPKPTFMWLLGGNGYHNYWYGNPKTLLKGSEEYLKDPAGGGPYKIKMWDPGNRIVFERREDFWADYPHWHKPQAKIMEILAVPDPAARFALLVSGQVDIVYNLPWALARKLIRSEDQGVRGVNPGKGSVWTQTYKANGMLVLTFGCPLQIREAAKPPDRVNRAGVTIPQWKVSAVCENHPTLDRRVRRALNLAIDKRALSKGPHFGFSTPIGSIYHAGSFGARPEVVSNPSPYDLQEAKRLMKEAGYENGFTMVGHFGQFAGRPGIPEAADFIASSWQKLGVKVTWQEHDPSDFVRSFRPGFFSSVPVNLQTWGRQDHSGLEVTNYNSTAGYVGVYNDKVEDLYFDINATPDPEEMKRKLALLEDEVLSLEETFPLYGMSLVNAYSDRVLAHPTVEFSPHFKHYDLVLLKH
jgi:ABC-type transport system substrate-binding protein